MSTTRSVRPTDLVALVTLDGRVYPNEARTWDQLGCPRGRRRILDSALVPWISFATGRQSWISARGQTVRGFVSARRRGNRAAWEIDCLIAATDDDWVVSSLLEQVAAEAARAGVLRIFLRLAQGSGLALPARRGGFVPYSEETLWRCDVGVPSLPLSDGLDVAPYRPSDAFALYRLYNLFAPEAVRRLEAPTFQQWQAAIERRATGRTGRNLVVRRGGEVIAQVRATRGRERAKIDVVVHPDASRELPAILGLACDHAGPRRPLFCLVPGYARDLACSLQDFGFEPDSHYIAYVKHTVQHLPAVKPAKAHATAARPAVAV
jgi:hypothetical protein